MICSRCKAEPSDGWPDGGDGELCQMCWEAVCSETWWDEICIHCGQDLVAHHHRNLKCPGDARTIYRRATPAPAPESDALLAFLKLTLLLYSGSPWDHDKSQEWARLSETILVLPSAEALRRGDKFDVTTRRLCDLGRAILTGLKEPHSK